MALFTYIHEFTSNLQKNCDVELWNNNNNADYSFGKYNKKKLQ